MEKSSVILHAWVANTCRTNADSLQRQSAQITWTETRDELSTFRLTNLLHSDGRKVLSTCHAKCWASYGSWHVGAVQSKYFWIYDIRSVIRHILLLITSVWNQTGTALFLQLMKPLGETSLLFVLCSSSLSHDHHSLNQCLSLKKKKLNRH